MSESAAHAELVKRLVQWISAGYVESRTLCVLSDGPSVPENEKPPMIGGFFPDVFAEDTPPTLTVIGEAKTARDLETLHSQRQLRAFIEFLSFRSKPHFVMAAPAFAISTAQNMAAAAKQELRAAHVVVTVI